jgi:signal transduction histidine kinase
MTSWIVSFLKTRAGRYATSVIALVVAAALTLVIVRFNLPRQITSYAFLLVIIGCAWWGGYGPGLITAFATLLLGPYLTQPAYSISHARLTTLPMIVLISVLISRMAGSREKIREANALLDERVRARTAELERVNRSLQEREAQLTAQAESLSQSNADLEQFAYFASHDLQEPLRMIGIYTELIEDSHRAQFGEESLMYARVVRESIRRLETLVNDLLSYSRAIHEHQMEQHEIESSDALRIATNNLDPSIGSNGAEIITNGLPRLIVPQTQLVQIFQNLIGNSLKYRSALPPVIHVSAEQRNDNWIFAVEDNGIGIHADYHENIFQPFKRLHGQQYPGSGVGLAICRRILERLGGRIWVESEAGLGSTFYFSLPIASAQKNPVQPLVQSPGIFLIKSASE